MIWFLIGLVIVLVLGKFILWAIEALLSLVWAVISAILQIFFGN